MRSRCLMLLCLLPLSCGGPIPPYRASIHSDDPGERILGIKAAAEARDQTAVPLLVDRLEDEDDGVRFFAILALERITGQRLGYDYADSNIDRARAVERWRQYVHQPDRAASRDTKGPRSDAGVNADTSGT